MNGSFQRHGLAFSYGWDGWDVLLFNDRITMLAIVGMLLIVVAGVLAAQLRSRQTAPETTNSSTPS